MAACVGSRGFMGRLSARYDDGAFQKEAAPTWQGIVAAKGPCLLVVAAVLCTGFRADPLWLTGLSNRSTARH